VDVEVVDGCVVADDRWAGWELPPHPASRINGRTVETAMASRRMSTMFSRLSTRIG
jgi:hypothetical protein